MAVADDRDPVAAGGAVRRHWGLALISGVMALVLAAVVLVQGRQLALAQQALRAGDGFSLTNLYQLELETLRLRDQWRTLQAGAAADPAALDALRLRYEIWVSRIGLARSPALAALMAGDADYAATVARLEAFVAAADPVLGKDRGTPGAQRVQALFDPLSALIVPVHEASLAAAHRLAERVDAGNRALQLQSRLGVALSVFLFALCALFAALATRQMRQLQQRRQALEDLTQRLHEARAQAEAASAAKSSFLADMSHEIRTPFQGLLGMLSLLRETGLTPRQSEHLRVATESADHLLAILNDILDMTQLESGRLTLAPAPLAVRELLAQTHALMRTPAMAKSLALYLDVDPAVPEWIVADATRLKQILFNLLSNAIKFCARGSISLELRLDPGPPERLLFIVTDTGVGMDTQTLQRLFQRFASTAAPAQRGTGGSGLGLEISRNLARLMGGDIDVHSRPGEGSRFSLALPLLRHTPMAAPAQVRAPEGALRALDVLVAEDHPVNRQYMASLLETLGHRAHFVADGRQAVQAVQAAHPHGYDLVLMDLHMPELDGIGATTAIRALPAPAAATVPIVALTADAFQETRERCLLAGMNDFLTKPVSPQDLSSALRRLFGQEAADRRPAPLPATAALAPEVDLIDRRAVDAALQGMPAPRLAALIASFLDQGAQTVEHMRTAVRGGQPLDLRVHAHAARGAALNLGLAALAQTAQSLHEGAAHLPAHEVAHLIQRYEKLLVRTREAAREAGLLQAA